MARTWSRLLAWLLINDTPITSDWLSSKGAKGCPSQDSLTTEEHSCAFVFVSERVVPDGRQRPQRQRRTRFRCGNSHQVPHRVRRGILCPSADFAVEHGLICREIASNSALTRAPSRVPSAFPRHSRR